MSLSTRIDQQRLSGQVALITGAGRGLGQSVAIAYARHGASVIVVSRTQSELDRTAEMIKKENGIIKTVAADIGNLSQLKSIFTDINESYQRLDILVNNAAVLPLKLFETMDEEEIASIFKINLLAPIYACGYAAEIMKKHKGGSIINVSSPSGYKGFEKESIYCASKHGLEGFSKTIAMEYAQNNIAVNVVTPGGFSSQVRIKPTSVTQLEFDNYSEEEKKKWNDPISFTEAFVFLGLQRASGITGERIAAFELSERIRNEGWNLSAKDLDFSVKGCSKY